MSETIDLGPLPEGWVWTRVKDVGDVKRGRQRSPKNHNGPYMRPYLRVANVFEGRIDTNDILYMNFSPKEYVKWAFEGKLADQAPNDEPASVLLERIKAEREARASKKKPGRRGRRAG